MSRIEDLEAQILDRDLPMLNCEKLTDEGLKVVFHFDQKICGLLQSDVQFSLLVKTINAVQHNEKLVSDFHITLEFKSQRL